jgi:hypothetical protein
MVAKQAEKATPKTAVISHAKAWEMLEKKFPGYQEEFWANVAEETEGQSRGESNEAAAARFVAEVRTRLNAVFTHNPAPGSMGCYRAKAQREIRQVVAPDKNPPREKSYSNGSVEVHTVPRSVERALRRAKKNAPHSRLAPLSVILDKSSGKRWFIARAYNGAEEVSRLVGLLVEERKL